MLRSQIAKLSHRDVRQRRRAIRSLFELDDSAALAAFIPLLKDKDPWFRSKAMQAIRRWYPGDAPESADELAKSGDVGFRRIAAEVLPRRRDSAKAEECLIRLTMDADDSVRLQAWTSRFRMDSELPMTTVELALKDDSAAIRNLALSSISGRDGAIEYAINALSDVNPRVSGEAVDLVLQSSGWTDEVAMKMKALAVDGLSDKLRAKAIRAILNRPDVDVANLNISTWLSPPRPIIISAIVEGLKESDWAIHESLVDSLKRIDSPALLARLLKNKRDEAADRIRASLLLDTEIDIVVRMKLLEDLIGRNLVGIGETTSAVRSLRTNDEGPLSSLATRVLTDPMAGLDGEEE
jgi:hypothetical protein